MSEITCVEKLETARHGKLNAEQLPMKSTACKEIGEGGAGGAVALEDTVRMITGPQLAAELQWGESKLAEEAFKGNVPGCEHLKGILGARRFPVRWSQRLQDLIDRERDARRRITVAREREARAVAARRELSAAESAMNAIDRTEYALARVRLQCGGLVGLDLGTITRIKAGLIRLLRDLEALRLAGSDPTDAD